MENSEKPDLPSFWDMLKEVNPGTLYDDSPPQELSAPVRAVWRLLKTVSDPMRGSDASCVSAAKEILDRLYGKVPVVERKENALSLADLDTSDLSGEELLTFQMLLQKMVMHKKKDTITRERK